MEEAMKAIEAGGDLIMSAAFLIFFSPVLLPMVLVGYGKRAWLNYQQRALTRKENDDE